MEEIAAKYKFFADCGYTPHPKQDEVHRSEARFRVIAAGARGGKSMLAGAEIAFTLLQPNKRVWCVATQYELADKEFDWALHFLSKIEVNGRRLLHLAR